MKGWLGATRRVCCAWLVLFALPAAAQQTVFYDDFSGPGGVDLSGRSPVTTSGASWVASSLFDADGGIAAASAGSATLSFTPTYGNVYMLDALFRGLTAGAGASAQENDWLALGFAAGQSAGSTLGDRFIADNVIGKAWSFVRGSTLSNANNSALVGSATSGTGNGSNWASLATQFGGDMDLRIVLDTSQSVTRYTATWYAKRPGAASYTQVRGPTDLESTWIDSVGIAKSNTGVTGSVSHFSLTRQPTPSGSPLDGYVRATPVGLGYAEGRINATSFARNNVVTAGNQQFLGYYEPAADGGNVVIARRTIGEDTWTRTVTSFVSNDIDDNHDIIAMAVDGEGIMHLSWGMHAEQNVGLPYNYARSTASVLTPGQPIGFTPNLDHPAMPGVGNNTRVTYPEFVNLPDGDLLYFFRSGGSGNGTLQLNRYDTDTDSWSALHNKLLDGSATAQHTTANAYWNTPTLDSDGNVHLSWLYRRSASSFQTNRDLYYAVSTTEGLTWVTDEGSPYTTPITQDTADRVIRIDENSSYINSTSMTVDQDNLPVIATRFAPGSGSGDNQVQQMLMWHDGSNWQTSQVSNFTTGEDGSRPSVLVDRSGRVVVLFNDSQLGGLVMAHSMDRQNWDYIELVENALGDWEPTYDLTRWERDGVISMLMQPMGLGNDAETVSLFEFDARRYFADQFGVLLGDFNGDGALTNSDIAPFVLALTDPSGYAAAFPELDPDALGDFSDDGVFTNADIAGFVDALTGSASLTAEQSSMLNAAVPEPSSLVLFVVGAFALMRRRGLFESGR